MVQEKYVPGGQNGDPASPRVPRRQQDHSILSSSKALITRPPESLSSFLLINAASLTLGSPVEAPVTRSLEGTRRQKKGAAAANERGK